MMTVRLEPIDLRMLRRGDEIACGDLITEATTIRDTVHFVTDGQSGLTSHVGAASDRIEIIRPENAPERGCAANGDVIQLLELEAGEISPVRPRGPDGRFIPRTPDE